MKILVHDAQHLGLAFALRCQDAGHSVRVWLPKGHDGTPSPIGDGLVEKVADWRPSMRWADLIVITDNSLYHADLEPFFKQGFPILGSNRQSSDLELDRAKGQQAFADCGIEILPYKTFSNFGEAAKFIEQSPESWVVKPWGGHSDKALSYVPPKGYEKPAMIFKLKCWAEEGLKGEFMLQQRVLGIEMGVSGWFGPGGWSEAIEEDWEEKEFMDGGLGPNTGEQGTTVRFVKKSKLFNEVLKPMTEYFHALGFVGNVNVNCMLTEDGPRPLEFTMRLGWPAFNIMLPLIVGDPANWMLDLLEGRDTLKIRPDIAIGVVLTTGDYPHSKLPPAKVCGYPIYGITEHSQESIHPQMMMLGTAPQEVGGSVKTLPCLVTAGDYVMVVTGLGDTVQAARRVVYSVVERIKWPAAIQYRTDIGRWLRAELPKMQAWGYATGVQYA